jgi:hypothetical protein
VGLPAAGTNSIGHGAVLHQPKLRKQAWCEVNNHQQMPGADPSSINRQHKSAHNPKNSLSINQSLIKEISNQLI